MEMIVFSGVQGSGKSTFYFERFAKSHLRINLDMLRTRNREDIILHACLAAQQPMVIDNTSPTIAQRARYATIGRAAGFRTVLYFFDISIETALTRNGNRSGAELVPEIGVRGTFAKLERPTNAEPFDQMFVVEVAQDGTTNVREVAG